jgi:hypothetical protein
VTKQPVLEQAHEIGFIYEEGERGDKRVDGRGGILVQQIGQEYLQVEMLSLMMERARPLIMVPILIGLTNL